MSRGAKIVALIAAAIIGGPIAWWVLRWWFYIFVDWNVAGGLSVAVVLLGVWVCFMVAAKIFVDGEP